MCDIWSAAWSLSVGKTAAIVPNKSFCNGYTKGDKKYMYMDFSYSFQDTYTIHFILTYNKFQTIWSYKKIVFIKNFKHQVLYSKYYGRNILQVL